MGWLLAHAATELARSLCVHGVSQFRARVPWLAGAAGGELVPLGTGHTQAAAGAGGPGWQRGGTAWSGGHRQDQGCSRLGTGFMVLVRKSAGEGAVDGGVDKGVRPLPLHSTPLPSHSTFIEDRTGARVVVAKACPNLLGPGGWAGRLR